MQQKKKKIEFYFWDSYIYLQLILSIFANVRKRTKIFIQKTKQKHERSKTMRSRSVHVFYSSFVFVVVITKLYKITKITNRQTKGEWILVINLYNFAK